MPRRADAARVRRRVLHAGRVRQPAADDRLLHRLADHLHVLHGHADRHVHPLLRDGLHARGTARGHGPRGHAARRLAPQAAGPVLPVLPVPVAVLLQHARAGAGRQHGDGVRVLGTGRHLLVLPDRLLHRTAERLERGQQGVHRQPRRRFRDDHRPDGPLGQPGHVRLRRRVGHRRGRPDAASSRGCSAWCGPAGPRRCRCRTAWCGCRRGTRSPRSCGRKARRPAPEEIERGHRSQAARMARRRPGRPRAALRLLAADRRRRGHLLRLRGQERPVPAARLVAGRDGRPHAGLRPGALGHDGRRRRVPGGPVLSGVCPGGAAGDRRDRLHHAVHGGHDRAYRDGHQAGAGLFDGQPAGLHDAGPGRGRLAGRACCT